jgi:putative ABC transport system permease protein
MSVTVTVCTTIDAPPATVWAAVENIESHTDWMKDAVRITFKSEQHSGVRAEFECLTRVGVVGVLDPVALDPNLDNAAFVTQWSAKHDFDTEGEPTKLYIRAAAGTTNETNDAIATAISLGGTDQVSTKIPTDALAASARADKTLQQTALFAGILALAVGGLVIANVMSISVIQRSSEIGIRRALGSTRSLIALQFLLEALFVGVLGGAIGALVGVGVVYLVSGLADWVVVIDYGKMPLWIGLAVGVSVVAGLYPSVKAARLEPLETLRLG